MYICVDSVTLRGVVHVGKKVVVAQKCAILLIVVPTTEKPKNIARIPPICKVADCKIAHSGLLKQRMFLYKHDKRF